jgi:hypothetical protein
MFVAMVMEGEALAVPSTVPMATTISEIFNAQVIWSTRILPNLGSRVGCSAAKSQNPTLQGPRSNARENPGRPKRGCGGGFMWERECGGGSEA